MPNEDGKDEAILQELREISNRHSRYNRSKDPIERSLSAVSLSASFGKEDTDKCVAHRDLATKNEGNEFLCQTSENPEHNQYWYSKNSINTLCNAIREGLSLHDGNRVAFLSTPSLYFSLSPEEREECALFDFDTSWESCSGYHFYDYSDPTNVKESCHGTFDLIVIDPPFISQSVWENYATTAKLLMKDNTARTIATTVDENTALMKDLFGCKPAIFRPSIPHLVYQYSAFTDFISPALSEKNPELVEETTH